MLRVSLPSHRLLVGAVGDGGWARELTERRFLDLGRTQSMMCHPAPR
jgi:hypothetical protein